MFALYKHQNIICVFFSQATQTGGRPVERARAWCHSVGVPFFRFSPYLNADIGLDCSSDKELVDMLWQTECYLHDHEDDIEQMIKLL